MTSINYIRLWVVPFYKKVQCLTIEEAKIARQLPKLKSRQYSFTRSHVRDILSKFFNIPALEVPLEAPPGKPPLLKNELGHISFGHCNDALIIGWSKYQLGVDIERKDRKINAKLIARKFYSSQENNFLNKTEDELFFYNFLKFWVLKEAAIKWQKGTIIKDLLYWRITNEFQEAIHDLEKSKLEAYLYDFKFWLIGLTYKKYGKQKIIISKV